jgi:hypothetical protein
MLKEYLGLIKLTLMALIISGSGYLGYSYSESKWESKESEIVASQAQMIKELEENYRILEGKTQNEFTKIDNTDQHRLLALQTAIDTNESVIGKLRAEIDKHKRMSKTSTYTGVNREFAATATTAVLYAELFGRANERARDLAITATEARNRGLSCEAKYDTVYKQYSF